MKDAYYFSHDSNARNDQRLMRIRMKHGIAGYGVYFGIIEILREQSEYYLYKNEITTIAYDLRVDETMVEDIILNYDLFEIDGDTFFSRSLTRRMEKLDEKREQRAKAGRKGGIATSLLKQNSTDAIPLKKRKVNKIKLNLNINIDFEKFWNLYDYKVGSKSKVLKKWESLTDLDRGMVMEHLPHYIKSTPDKKFRKHPATYLNNQGWFDEIVISQNGAIDFKLDSTGKFYIGYCDKCNTSSFYKKEGIYGDSTCCNAKILNERKKYDKESN